MRLTIEHTGTITVDLNVTVGLGNLEAIVERVAASLAEKLRPVIRQEILPMSKEVDDMIVVAHKQMDAATASLGVMNTLHDLWVASNGDPAKAVALMNEFAAKTDEINLAIANDDPNAPPPVVPIV